MEPGTLVVRIRCIMTTTWSIRFKTKENFEMWTDFNLSLQWNFVFTHCHDGQPRRPNRTHCCLDSSVVFRIHCSAHTMTCPTIQGGNWCVNRFLYGKSCSNGNVWCASTTHLAGDESKSVWSIFAYIYTNCNSKALFRPALQSKNSWFESIIKSIIH